MREQAGSKNGNSIVAIGYCWLIQQISSNSSQWSVNCFWWGWFAPPRLLRPGQLPPLPTPIYATANCKNFVGSETVADVV